MDFWTRMESIGPQSVLADGVELREGSRVRLHPRSRGDIFDMALDGQIGVVESVEEDDAGEFQVVVVLADDPGRDLGEARMPGHRFFFSLTDVEPLGEADAGGTTGPRVLVAGIGNLFLGDDGFGVEVVRQLAERELPSGVDVVDFGIRGMDLAFALQRDYQTVIFVDTAARGEAPGTLSVIEPALPHDGEVSMDTHGMDPVKVLRLAREMGGITAHTLRVVACEPENVLTGAPDEDVVMELSGPVRAAIDEAARLVETLVAEFTAATPASGAPNESQETKGGSTQ